MNLLDHLLDDLKREREQIAYLQTNLKEKTEAFRVSIKDIVNDLDITVEEAERLRAKITDIALEMYIADPNHSKAIHSKIKEKDVLNIQYDEEDALVWCIQHGLFLLVNRKGLESFVRALKGVGIPAFVTIEVIPTITIAQEL